MTYGPQVPIAYIVDDDAAVRTALRRGLASVGIPAAAFDGPAEFLAVHDPALPGCVVADVAMPGMSGLELQALLASRGCTRPIIFVTAKGSIPLSVQAMKAGAVTFLPKPVRLAELVAAVREAFDLDARRREAQAERSDIESRLGALTSREREVLDLIVLGKLNKQIAAALGAAEKTIKVHRGRVMAKLHVRSVAELVTLTTRIPR
jgi:FixJ family two-component response regulator